jgi:hypothetical protein
MSLILVIILSLVTYVVTYYVEHYIQFHVREMHLYLPLGFPRYAKNFKILSISLFWIILFLSFYNFSWLGLLQIPICLSIGFKGRIDSESLARKDFIEYPSDNSYGISFEKYWELS